MQKIEYTCDRCGATKPAERMYRLRVSAVLAVEKHGEELLDRLLDDKQKELCDDCRVELNDWFGQKR